MVIRYPETYKSPDYFIRPFENEVWYTVIAITIFCSVALLLAQLLRKNMIAERETSHFLIDDIFLPLDCFFNQGFFFQTLETIQILRQHRIGPFKYYVEILKEISHTCNSGSSIFFS